MAENETAENDTESSVVTYTDEKGLVHYAGRHSKAYRKHLAQQKNADTVGPPESGEVAEPANEPAAPADTPVRVVGTDPVATEIVDGKTARPARKADPKS
ncbi:hypothetical protein [Rhodococcus pyridinivorans]|uniref:hypothetical protein n=1 Tax=Rhodococcus pyridinivorans TaxID=103816 RepID=UPI003AAFB93C